MRRPIPSTAGAGTARHGTPAILLACAALALGLLGCGGSAERSAGGVRGPRAGASPAAFRDGYFGDVTPPAGQVFTFNNGAEPELLDPGLMSGQPDGRIARMLFEGLTASDPKSLEPLPGQAYRWDVSPDGCCYTFHLRPGLVWGDGHPLAARDFLWSWRRVLAPATGSRYANLLYLVRNGEAYNKGTLLDSTQVGLAAPDDSTFVVTLERPTPYFLFLAAYYTFAPVPRHVVEAYGDLWTRDEHLIGNGAFRLAGHVAGEKFVLAPNERYWDRKSVRLTKIVALDVEDLGTAANLYKAGVIDWNPSGYLRKQALPYLSRFRDFQTGPQQAVYFYSMVVTRTPFDNVWVRRALNYAVDREKIAQYLLKGTVRAWGNLTPSGYPGYPAPPAVSFDAEKARACLARAGYPGGKGFPKIEILFNTSEDHRMIAEAIQDMWRRELHIPVALSNQEWASYLAATTAKRYDVARRSWIGDYLDPTTFLSLWTTDNGNNRTGWSSARYDGLLKAADHESDPQRRLALLARAEALLLDEGPAIPIYHYELSALVKPYVRGMYPTLLDEHPLKGIWIDQDWSHRPPETAGLVPGGVP